jgi:hypothetical protein
MKHQNQRPVAIEDLLRLKRAERPSPEFWQDFDRSLRAKQLSALVAKRPWWQRLPETLGGLGRYRIPLGATAILAITVITLRDEPTPVNLPEVSSAVDNVAAAAVAHPISAEGVAGGLAEEDAVSLLTPAASSPTAVAASASASGELVQTVALLNEVPAAGTADFDSPSARTIAANLVAAQVAETLPAGLLPGAAAFEVRSARTRTTAVDPLQQMTPPGEVRRARFLNAMVATAVTHVSAQASARMANRISDEELYDRVQRVGTRSGGVNFKF